MLSVNSISLFTYLDDRFEKSGSILCIFFNNGFFCVFNNKINIFSASFRVFQKREEQILCLVYNMRICNFFGFVIQQRPYRQIMFCFGTAFVLFYFIFGCFSLCCVLHNQNVHFAAIVGIAYSLLFLPMSLYTKLLLISTSVPRLRFTPSIPFIVLRLNQN